MKLVISVYPNWYTVEWWYITIMQRCDQYVPPNINDSTGYLRRLSNISRYTWKVGDDLVHCMMVGNGRLVTYEANTVIHPIIKQYVYLCKARTVGASYTAYGWLDISNEGKVKQEARIILLLCNVIKYHDVIHQRAYIHFFITASSITLSNKDGSHC